MKTTVLIGHSDDTYQVKMKASSSHVIGFVDPSFKTPCYFNTGLIVLFRFFCVSTIPLLLLSNKCKEKEFIIHKKIFCVPDIPPPSYGQSLEMRTFVVGWKLAMNLRQYHFILFAIIKKHWTKTIYCNVVSVCSIVALSIECLVKWTLWWHLSR